MLEKKIAPKIDDAQKFKIVRREAIYTGIALIALIFFWLIAGFGTASIDVKIFHLPLWAILGTIGVWIFAILISFVLSKKLFKDMDLGAATMNEGSFAALVPLIIFMAVMVGISFFVKHRQAGKNFLGSYFVGNRELGGFVLAMTTVATYSSVSSFVGGPGRAFTVGFGWI